MDSCDNCKAKQLNFLKSLTPEALDRLQKSSTPLQFKKGETIFFEDEQLQELFCIREGACKFSKTNKKEDEQIINLLGEGELMGRRSVISQKGALVTATAVTATTLCCMPQKLVLENIQNNNAFCLDVLNGFITDTIDDVEKVNFYKNNRSMKKRLAGLLLYLSKKFGIDGNGWLKVSLTRSDMANILGTTSEYIIALLTSFKEKKHIISEKRKIKLVNTIALSEMIGDRH